MMFSWVSVNLNAQQLTVLTDSDQSQIYVNKVLKGTANLINEEMMPGTYLVEVYDNGAVVYSEITTIEEGKNKTLYINISDLKLSKNVMNLKQSYLQAGYVLEQKGNLGFGFNLDYAGISGLQIALDQKSYNLTHQVVFWVTNIKSNETEQINYRFIKYFKSKISSNQVWLIRPYYGVGAGYSRKKTDDYTTKKSVFELPLGFQFAKIKHDENHLKQPKTAFKTIIDIYFWPFTLTTYMFDKFTGAAADSLYYHIETGMNVINIDSNDPNAWSDYTGLRIAGGLIYYF